MPKKTPKKHPKWPISPDFFTFIPAYRASPTTYGKPFRPFSTVLRKTYGTPSLRKRKKLAFPENENIGLLWSKVPMFCLESTDVSFKEVRCFWFPEAVPHENCREWQCWVRCSRWRSSSSIARRQTSPQKKFLKKNIHFLHPFTKTPLYAMLFGCRIGCRITSFGVGLV